MNAAPTRPALRYLGGKFLLAEWIIKHFPPHRIYVEPFGGGASVLLRKERAYAEVYNDLAGEVVGLFRVLRDPALAPRLIELVRLTPFARGEFEAAYEASGDAVEAARRLLVRSFMGFGSTGFNPRVRTGFRAAPTQSHTRPASDWRHYPEALGVIVERLTGVVIECRPALEVLDLHDGPETLFYLDPPYMPETRSTKSKFGGTLYHGYIHEMSVADHEALLARILGLRAAVVLSGYPTQLYDDALGGWRRVERAALADGARKRTEVLWMNRAAFNRAGELELAR